MLINGTTLLLDKKVNNQNYSYSQGHDQYIILYISVLEPLHGFTAVFGAFANKIHDPVQYIIVEHFACAAETFHSSDNNGVVKFINIKLSGRESFPTRVFLLRYRSVFFHHEIGRASCRYTVEICA